MAAFDIGRSGERNFVGMCHIDYVDVDDVVSVPEEFEGNIADDITLVEDVEWSRIYLEQPGSQFQENWADASGDTVARSILSGNIAKDRLALMPNLWKMKGHRYLALITTPNGDQLLMGTKSEPCQIRVPLRSLGGKNVDSDTAGYDIAFTLERSIPVPFYHGTPPTPSTPGSCDDATVKTTDDSTEVMTIASGAEGQLPESVIPYDDAAGDEQTTAPANTDYDGTYLLRNGPIPRRQVLNSASDPANATYACLADLLNGTLPVAGDANVKTTDGGTLVGTIPANSSGDLPESVVDYIDPSGASQTTSADDTNYSGGYLRKNMAFDVRTLKSGIAYRFGPELWSGESTSYGTGSEGALFAAGWFNYTPPLYPDRVQYLVDWYTLGVNNKFGNTTRFTNESGSAAATSGNRYVLDHLTGLMRYIPGTLPTADTWANALAAAEAATFGSYTDWHLDSKDTMKTVKLNQGSSPLNYGPYLITASLWTCTTKGASTTVAYRYLDTYAQSAEHAKTNSNSWIYVRKFHND